MIVLARPAPDYRGLLRRSAALEGDYSRLLFFPRGRDALRAGLEALRIKPGAAVVVPSYICDSTIAPLRASGYRIVYVDIQPDLQFDVAKIVEVIGRSEARAVLVVHYFGFPVDVARLMAACRPLGVKVIEDCCHGFLSRVNGVSVGAVGDASIFSMRKTLPIADGGALRVNVDSEMDELLTNGVDRPPSGVRYLVARTVESAVARVGWPNLYSPGIDRLKRRIRGSRPVSAEMEEIADARPVAPSSQLLGYLGDTDYLEQVGRRVAENYRFLMDAAIALGYEPLIRDLDTGWVPQWAPLYDRAGGMVEWLRGRGIGAGRWPWHEMPRAVADGPGDYPVTHQLDRHLALLPVHQGVGERHRQAIVSALDGWRKTRSGLAL